MYVAIGVVCAALDLGIMQALLWNGAVAWVAASVAFIVCVVVNYTAHAKLTFDAPSSLPSFLRFLVIVGLNYVITIACVQAAHAIIDNAMIGKILSYPIVTLNGFLLGKHWVFRSA
ncbi:GtrA family protein [Cupriavidus sp. CP313]